MKISEILNKKEPTLSFEVFPPKTSDGFENVEKATNAIADLKPDFMSVTYGAGGSTRSNTIKIAEDEIANGNKVIIFCCFDKELYTLQEYFGSRCVIYNGKMTAKTKDKNFKHFKENDDCKVFIGNLQSASVGLNLNEANAVIFNNAFKMSYSGL